MDRKSKNYLFAKNEVNGRTSDNNFLKRYCLKLGNHLTVTQLLKTKQKRLLSSKRHFIIINFQR